MVSLVAIKYVGDKLTYLRLFLVSLCLAFASSAFAADMPVGNAEHGKELSTTCATCHGADGKAIAPTYPNLAGQSASYLYNSLVAYKQGATGSRNNAIMMGMATPLSEQDMADLAAYFSSLPVTHGQADTALVARGEKIYRGGIPSMKVPACSGCHQPDGAGNRLAGFPHLAGQNPDYVVAQLQAFREGQRGGGYNGMMHDVSLGMTTDDMKAVASYISGLHQ